MRRPYSAPPKAHLLRYAVLFFVVVYLLAVPARTLFNSAEMVEPQSARRDSNAANRQPQQNYGMRDVLELPKLFRHLPESFSETLGCPEYLTRSLSPRLLFFPNFLTVEDADHLRGLQDNTASDLVVQRVLHTLEIIANWSMPKCASPDPSAAPYRHGRSREAASSTACFHMRRKGVDVVRKVDEVPQVKFDHLGGVTGVNAIARKLHGAMQRAHHPMSTPPSESVLDYMATLFLFIGDSESGGEIGFPLLVERDGMPTIRGRPSCQSAKMFFVSPVAGAAVLLYNLHRNGTADSRATYVVCPTNSSSSRYAYAQARIMIEVPL